MQDLLLPPRRPRFVEQVGGAGVFDHALDPRHAQHAHPGTTGRLGLFGGLGQPTRVFLQCGPVPAQGPLHAANVGAQRLGTWLRIEPVPLGPLPHTEEHTAKLLVEILEIFLKLLEQRLEIRKLQIIRVGQPLDPWQLVIIAVQQALRQNGLRPGFRRGLGTARTQPLRGYDHGHDQHDSDRHANE